MLDHQLNHIVASFCYLKDFFETSIYQRHSAPLKHLQKYTNFYSSLVDFVDVVHRRTGISIISCPRTEIFRDITSFLRYHKPYETRNEKELFLEALEPLSTEKSLIRKRSLLQDSTIVYTGLRRPNILFRYYNEERRARRFHPISVHSFIAAI